MPRMDDAPFGYNGQAQISWNVLATVGDSMHLDQEHAEDTLRTSDELKRVLSKTPKFRPTPSNIKPSTVVADCDVFGHRLIKTFNLYARAISSELMLNF
jgi:hypothetical protein